MSEKVLKYKGYHGTVEVDLNKGCLYGKVLHIKSLISYAGQTPQELKESFEEEISDYLEDCKEMNIAPEKPFSGTFQIRCGPQLHKELTLRALDAGTSFNKYVVMALEREVQA